jgi:TetR/AcrR family transcriptional regulator, ethionamide resistance regulator
MARLSRRSDRARPGRRDEMQGKLLAALERQLEGGTSLADVKVSDLAAEAGVSRATFYIHFQDKVDLIEEWLLETIQVLYDVSNDWYSASPDLTRDRLRDLLRAVFDAYRERLTLMSAMHETALYDETLRAEFAEAFELHISALTDHIRSGQRAGVIDSDLRPRETAEWLVCMMERVPVQIRRDAGRKESEAHLEAATGVIWSTLYAEAA